MKPKVLIAIPTLNEVKNIESVLFNLFSDMPEAYDFVVVVVDAGSTDGTVQTVEALFSKYPNLRTIKNIAKLQSVGVNLAVKHFGQGCEVLIRCDAHARYQDSFVRKLLSKLAETKADSVVIPMHSTGKTCFQKAVAWLSDNKFGNGGASHRAGIVSGYVDHGHHAAFKMKTFKQVGGYDESFSHNEDAEYDCRQSAIGAAIYLDAENSIEYFPRSTMLSLFKQYFSYGKGRSRTVRRHPASLRLRQFAIPFQLLLIVAAVVSIYWSWYPSLWILFCVLAYAAISLYIALKHRSSCGLFAGLAGFIMHTAWGLGFYYGFLTTTETRWDKSDLKPLICEDEKQKKAREV